jgi:hypothetical protein
MRRCCTPAHCRVALFRTLLPSFVAPVAMAVFTLGVVVVELPSPCVSRVAVI